MENHEQQDEISLKGLLGLALLKKEEYFGSHRGMRFRLCQADEQLQATIYPEPFGWDATPEEQKESACFPFSEQGLSLAVQWLNQSYREKYRTHT